MVNNHLLKNNQMYYHIFLSIFQFNKNRDMWHIIIGDKSNYDHII
jgi:hypothetical protein